MINTCIECGDDYKAERSTSKFCSANCRVKFNNKLKSINKHTDNFNSKKEEIKLDEVRLWIKEVEDYCTSIGMIPSDLILFHKEFSGNKFSKVKYTPPNNNSERSKTDEINTENKSTTDGKQSKESPTKSTKEKLNNIIELPKKKIIINNKEMIEPEPGTNAYFLRHGHY